MTTRMHQLCNWPGGEETIQGEEKMIQVVSTPPRRALTTTIGSLPGEALLPGKCFQFLAKLPRKAG